MDDLVSDSHELGVDWGALTVKMIVILKIEIGTQIHGLIAKED